MDDQGLSAALKGCPNPWCASTTAPLPVKGLSGWRVACGCGVQTGPAYFTAAEAIKLWNTRSPPPGDREEVARRIEVILRDEIGRQFSAARDDGLNDVRIATIVSRATGRILALSASPAGWRPTHRHVKRGTDYEVIGNAELQNADDARLSDGDTMTVYRGQDGKLWVRWANEFLDGRFVALPAPPVPTEGADPSAA